RLPAPVRPGRAGRGSSVRQEAIPSPRVVSPRPAGRTAPDARSSRAPLLAPVAEVPSPHRRLPAVRAPVEPAEHVRQDHRVAAVGPTDAPVPARCVRVFAAPTPAVHALWCLSVAGGAARVDDPPRAGPARAAVRLVVVTLEELHRVSSGSYSTRAGRAISSAKLASSSPAAHHPVGHFCHGSGRTPP